MGFVLDTGWQKWDGLEGFCYDCRELVGSRGEALFPWAGIFSRPRRQSAIAVVLVFPLGTEEGEREREREREKEAPEQVREKEKSRTHFTDCRAHVVRLGCKCLGWCLSVLERSPSLLARALVVGGHSPFWPASAMTQKSGL